MSSGNRGSTPLPVIRGPQEIQHIQERFERVVDPSRAPTALEPPAPSHRPKATWKPAPGLASALWLVSSVFAVAAASLFTLPAVRDLLAPKPAAVVYAPTPPTPPPPAQPALNPDTTEESSEFEGYILMVDSEPGGATVLVNGKDQGEVPVSVGLDCSPGDRVLVELSLQGFERVRHTTTCKRDTMVKVSARLRKKP